MLFWVGVFIIVVDTVMAVLLFNNPLIPRNSRFGLALCAVSIPIALLIIFKAPNQIIFDIALAWGLGMSLFLSFVFLRMINRNIHKANPGYYHVKRNEAVAYSMLVLGMNKHGMLNLSRREQNYLKSFLDGIDDSRLKTAQPIAEKGLKRARASADYVNFNMDFSFHDIKKEIRKYHRKYGNK